MMAICGHIGMMYLNVLNKYIMTKRQRKTLNRLHELVAEYQ